MSDRRRRWGILAAAAGAALCVGCSRSVRDHESHVYWEGGLFVLLGLIVAVLILQGR